METMKQLMRALPGGWVLLAPGAPIPEVHRTASVSYKNTSWSLCSGCSYVGRPNDDETLLVAVPADSNQQPLHEDFGG